MAKALRSTIGASSYESEDDLVFYESERRTPLANKAIEASFCSALRKIGISEETRKAVSLALILRGAALIGFVDPVGVVWIILSWIPGVVLMIQQTMNSRITLRFGTHSMLLVNYTTALTALAFAVLLSHSSVGTICHVIDRASVVVLLGGCVLGVVVVALAAFLLTRSPALQVTPRIILDALSSCLFAPANAIGIALVILGPSAGWLTDWRRRSHPAV